MGYGLVSAQDGKLRWPADDLFFFGSVDVHGCLSWKSSVVGVVVN